MFVGVFIVLVAAAVLAVGWFASERAIHPPQAGYPWSIRDYSNLKPQAVTFTSRDGISLSGQFFPGSSPAIVILSHGYGDNKDQMAPWADFLNRAGFSSFAYDMRDRGQSGGSAVTLGALEWIDLQSAVDYLVTRDDVDPERVGAFGLSLGGSVSILAAANDARIKGVVADSSFSDAKNVISRGFKLIFHLPAFPFAPVTVRFAEWKTGARVHDIRPANVIGQISPRPILLIHGEEDSLVTPKNASENFAAAREPKEIWWVPGADHVQAGARRQEEYETRIVAFFRRALNVPVEDQSAAQSRALE